MSKRFGIIFIILVSPAFLLAFYHLSLRLVSQLYYLKANHDIDNKKYDIAIDHLEKAVQYQSSDPEIWKTLGRGYHLQGKQKSIKAAYHLLTRAKHAYQKAAFMNPIDAEAFFGLSVEEVGLEKLHPYVDHQKYPGTPNALPYFQKALRLWPDSYQYNLAFVKYLSQKEEKELLLKTVNHLAQIYPQAYGSIKKESFWSSDIKEAFKTGLKQATRKKHLSLSAHAALSSLFFEEKSFSDAIYHYQRGAIFQKKFNPIKYYTHLGKLYLQNGQLRDAEESFFNLVSNSKDIEKTMADLYNIYKKKGDTEKFIRFYQRAAKRFKLSPSTDLFLARSMMDVNQYDQAKKILLAMNKEEQSSTVYFWLFRIAEKEKDLSGMELAIQKATILEPTNSRYHLIFSKLLSWKKKLDMAEKEAGLAIDYSNKPSSGLFNHRALIRMGKKDYSGAIKDWKSAIILQPKNAHLYSKVANAYEKMRDWPSAADYYHKALNLDPKNKNFQKKIHDLREKHSLTQSN